MINANTVRPGMRNQKNKMYIPQLREETGWHMKRNPRFQYEHTISTKIRGFDVRWAIKPPFKEGREGRIFCSAYFNDSTSNIAKEMYQYIHDTYKETVNQAFKDYRVEWKNGAKKDQQIRISFAETQNDDCGDWIINQSLPLILDTVFPCIVEYIQARSYLYGWEDRYNFVTASDSSDYRHFLREWRNIL
jgi:hypothetical protein